nr:MAG TPA: hypothetical protein [Caudoviricetes sp.]
MSDHRARAAHRSQSHLLRRQQHRVCQSEYRSTRYWPYSETAR